MTPDHARVNQTNTQEVTFNVPNIGGGGELVPVTYYMHPLIQHSANTLSNSIARRGHWFYCQKQDE